MKKDLMISFSKRKGAIPLFRFIVPLLLFCTPVLTANRRVPSTLLLQQGIEITGTVTDSSTSTALSGVNIAIYGTSSGVITHDNGHFTITVPGENAILVFTYVGYSTESVIVGSDRTINLAMAPEAQKMEELVFIGYGTIRKSDLTGAVSSIDQAEIEKAAPTDVLSAIQGRAAGVYISQNSGAPGLEPVIRIRGIGSINPHAPIYVIDGVIMDNSDARDKAGTINFLNPADIASIEVLKDASATAIYGSRGANGVILITTRKGLNSAPKVSFNAQLGFAKPRPFPETLDTAEYMDYVLEAFANGKSTTQPDTLVHVKEVIEQYNKGYDTDWMEAVLKDRPSLSMNYTFSVRGGNSNARYASSFGYYDEEGILATNSRYRRYSFRINSEFDPGSIFKFGENLAISQSNLLGPKQPDVGFIKSAAGTSPIYPVYKSPADPGYKDPGDPEYDYYKFAGSPIGNPVADNYYQYNTHTNTLTLFGNLYAEATLLRYFTLRSSLGVRLSNRKMDDFVPEYEVTNSNLQTFSKVSKESNWTNGWLWDNTITYHQAPGRHEITILAGYSSEYNKYDYLGGSKTATPSNAEEMRVLDAAISTPELDGGYNIITMISMFGRLNYAFNSRYLLTVSIRRDGNSQFGPGNRWGVFPSVSLGWNISNEDFLKRLNINVISNLKLRTSWGRIGNSNIYATNANPYQSQFASSNDYRALFDNIPHTGYILEVIGNPDLGWETAEQVNVGLDAGLFRNKLTITSDYFVKTTRNMLIRTHVPLYAGYGDYSEPWFNAGSMENRGFEFQVDYHGNAGMFSYDISLNGSTFKNRLLSTNIDSTDISDIFNPFIISRIGYPVGSLYGYVTDGIFQSLEEVAAHRDTVTGELLQPNALPGDVRFRNLNNDSTISAGPAWDGKNGGDETIIGNPYPKFIFGFTINLTYRGFDLMTHWQGTYGNQMINYARYRPNYITYRLNGIENPPRDLYLNAWRESNPSDSDPRITSHDENDNFRISDLMLEDASYLRMKLIQLGYTLPETLLTKLHLGSCRIWIGGTDLLTFTRYSGNDPEIALYDPTISGIDLGTAYPRSRKVMIGINMEF